MSDYKTSTILNAIRNNASPAYKDRIPEATAANIAEIGTAILEYDAARNEFMSTLVNKIALSVIKGGKQYTNPLKEFKKGSIPNGTTIEEIYVELIKSAAFDMENAADKVFALAPPDVRSIFHSIDRDDQYKATTTRYQLKQAFTSDSSMMDLVNRIVAIMYTSDEMDEFLVMKNVIQMYGTEGKFYPVVVTDVTNEATAKAAMAKIKEFSNNMTFMRRDYNFAGVANFTPKADQIVLINTKFDALVDVEVLASAFNMEKTDFIGRRVLVDDFGGLSNVLCAIVDRDWFMMYDTDMFGDSIYNPQGAYTNHFLTHRGIYSVSPFENAILFVTASPTVSSIKVYNRAGAESLSLSNSSKAQSVQLYCIASGTNYAPSKATWTIDDATCSVNSQGFVVIPSTVQNKIVTVTATNVYDATKTDTFAITVGTPA